MVVVACGGGGGECGAVLDVVEVRGCVDPFVVVVAIAVVDRQALGSCGRGGRCWCGDQCGVRW